MGGSRKTTGAGGAMATAPAALADEANGARVFTTRAKDEAVRDTGAVAIEAGEYRYEFPRATVTVEAPHDVTAADLAPVLELSARADDSAFAAA